VHTLATHPSTSWRLACLTAALVAWYGLQVWAATVSSPTVGRYEIIVQEGLPVAVGEIVARCAGRPDCPSIRWYWERKNVCWSSASSARKSSIPPRLYGVRGPRGTGTATARFIVERSVRQDETLTLWVRQVNAPRQVSLAVDLRNLERMLEGPR